MDVALRIRDIMTDRDIHIRTMAEQIGQKEGTLGGYLRGDRTLPYDVLVRLVNQLKITTDYALGLTDNPEIPLRLSDSERRLILDLRTLNPDQKAIAAQTVQLMAEQNRR